MKRNSSSAGNSDNGSATRAAKGAGSGKSMLDPALLRELLAVPARALRRAHVASVLELVPVAIQVCDATGRVTFSNRRALELLGQPASARKPAKPVAAPRLLKIDGSAIPFEATPAAIAAREGRAVRDLEARIERADGSTLAVAVSVEPIRDGNGAIGGTLTVFQDISTRKAVEEKVRARDTELQLLRAQAPIILSHWDNENRLIFASRAFAERWKTTPENLLGRTVAEILGETAYAALRPHVERALRGEHVEFEMEVPYTQIGRRFVRAAYAPDVSEDGRVRGYLAAVIDMTERRRAEAALQQSEERLRMATRTGKVGLWDWDIGANRVTWTESLYQIHGVEPAEFPATAEAFLSLVHPEDRAPVERAVRSTLELGTPYELEFRAVRPRGGVVWLFTNAIVIREAGRPVRMAGATLDITARKNAELALRESETRFRTLASHAPVGIFLTDTNGDYVYVNETWRMMSGLGPDEARGKGWTRAVHPDDRERVAAGWSEAARASRAFAAEFRFQRPDGVVFWLEGSAVQSRKSNGDVMGYIGILVDITQRKGAEDALRESEKRFRTLASHAPVGIFLTNSEGDTMFVNESWTKIVGLPAERARGSGWMEALHPDDRERVVREWQAARVRGVAATSEYRFRRADGSIAWVQGHAVQLRDEAGRPAGYIGTIADVTERKIADERLRAQEAQLRLISTNAPIILAHLNREQRFLFVNRAYAERFGVQAEDVIGRTVQDVLGPEAAAAIAPYVERVLRGESVTYEAEVPYRSIGRRFMHVAYVPDIAADGTVRGWLSAVIDMTDHKATEDALRRLAAIVESSDDAIISKDLDGVITSWNQGAERVFGYSAGEAVRRSIRLLIPAGREDEETAIIARIRAGTPVEHFETVRQRKDGSLIDVSLTVSPLKDTSGRVVGASTIARDITDRNRAARELGRHALSLEALHRVGTTLAAELDPTKILQSVTEAGREVGGARFGAFFGGPKAGTAEGFTLHTLSGVTPDMIAIAAPQRHDALLQRACEGRGSLRLSDVLTDPRCDEGAAVIQVSGQSPTRSYLIVPVTSHSTGVLGVLVFGHVAPKAFAEETERTVLGIAAQAAIAMDNANLYRALSHELQEKSRAEAGLRVAQEQLQAHATELEQKVRDRTASLRELVVQMEEFSYSVSHDLRAPLRAMNAYAQALVEDYGPQLDDTAKNYLARIQRSSQRMEKLTHDVLTYSRVARAELALAPIDLELILRDVVTQYAELQPPATDVEVVRPLLRVMGHESLLGQCMANLLTNAAKFVARGVQPRIRVRTERIGDKVRVWVEDNGIGIPAQYQSKLFRVFERAPTSHHYEGTGIGLAIVRKAAEKMSGRCGVESDGQYGSRFWIELGGE